MFRRVFSQFRTNVQEKQGLLIPLLQYCTTSNKLRTRWQKEPPIEWKHAKPMTEIPSPPKQMFIGHLRLIMKNIKSLHTLHDTLRKKYGNIVLLKVPGRYIVCIYDPDDSRLLYINDGKTPSNPGFEPIAIYR